MKLERSNLQTFCRTCLKCLKPTVETSQTASVKTYDIRETPDLSKMLIICTALNIIGGADMMYPQRICSKCYHTLLEFKRFREMASKSHEVLHGIIENADGVFIAEYVDAAYHLPEKSENATAENNNKHFEGSKPKLYSGISEDETGPSNDGLEIEYMMGENNAPNLFGADPLSGNVADIDVNRSSADAVPTSSKVANKRKLIADNDNEELFQCAYSSGEAVLNSNEVLHKQWKTKDSFQKVRVRRRHRRTQSKQVVKQTEETTYTTVISSLSPNEIKAKIINGDLTINEKTGRSKVWNIFGSVINESREMISGVVACKSCLNIYKLSKSTSNLVRHKCYSSKYGAEMQGDIDPKLNEKSTSETAVKMDSDIVPKIFVDSECKKRGVRAFTQWTLENFRSYEIADDSGFRNIAQYFIWVGAKFGENVDLERVIPHPTAISNTVANIYGLIREKVKSQINLIRDVGFGLTSDIWTDHYSSKSYIALTMHYIKEGSIFTRLLGLQSLEGERCTHENVQKKVRNMLMAFNCDLNNNAIIVTNRGSNMVAAFDSFQHVFCINHLINNALQKTVEEVSALKDLSGLCSKLVKYFKKSGINSSVQSTINSYSPTRWNTTYCLLKSIQQNWTEINQVLQEKNELQRIKNINLTQLQGIIAILEPFEESFTKLEGETYPTIHLTLMHINRLVKKCCPESADQTMVKEVKERLRINLESTVIKNLTVYHKVALFLFPPANKMIQFDEGDKQLVKDQCKVMMREYQSEIPAIQLSASNQELVADYIPSTEVINGDLAIDYELLMYEKYNVAFHDGFDILNWWYQNKTEFPLLFKVSCKILATPASSAPSERILSLLRNLISENMKANINSLNQIMFVNVNVGKDNISRVFNL